jgi:putative ABC transport system substrate-binding protein
MTGRSIFEGRIIVRRLASEMTPRLRLSPGAGVAWLMAMATCAIGLFVALLSTDAPAQPARRLPRVGALVIAERPGELPVDAFRLAMKDLGYVDGRNVVLEWRYARGQPARLPTLAAELVRLGVDVLYCAGPDPAVAARAATSTIPIVVVGARDSVVSGWAASLSRPGGNITGFLVIVPGLHGKNLSLIKEAAPRVARVAVLTDLTAEPEGSPEARALVKELEESARQLRLQIRFFGVKGPAEFEGVFRAASDWRADALLNYETAMLYGHRTTLAALVLRNRLPAAAVVKATAEAGFLLANGPDIAALHRRGAAYVDKILKGAKPGELPFQQPEKLELVINVKTAKALALTIPPSLLARANHVLE